MLIYFLRHLCPKFFGLKGKRLKMNDIAISLKGVTKVFGETVANTDFGR